MKYKNMDDLAEYRDLFFLFDQKTVGRKYIKYYLIYVVGLHPLSAVI